MSRPHLALAVALSIGAAAAAPARAQHLPDSTVAMSWKLANGLEVRARHVPGAAGVAISMAYRAGVLQQPAGREGLAELLAELQFTSPAGEIPERSREEMGSLRPLGWDVRVNDHLVVLTEVASTGQFPGVLRQVSTRARGVQVSDSSFRHAVLAVRADFGRQRFGDVEPALYYRVREVARGLDDAAILRKANGDGFKGLSAREATEHLRRLYVPANAALSLVGDFANLDVRALVEREFGDIPAGTAAPDTTGPALHGAARNTTREGLTSPFAAVGIIAPPLDDSLHAAFYLTTLMLGPWWSDQQRPKNPSLTSYFQYSLFDEPDLVRFDVEPTAEMVDASSLTDFFRTGLAYYGLALVTDTDYDKVRRSVDWLLGGPLPPVLFRQARRDPGTLATLGFSAASRALWRGDAFWDRYRRNFELCRFGSTWFTTWMSDTEHQARLLIRPKP